MEKECCRCHIVQDINEFYKWSRGKDGRQSYCRTCDLAAKARHYKEHQAETIARVNRWQLDNWEKVKQYKRKWKRNNPNSILQYKHKRRSIESQEHFTAEEWQRLLEKSGSRCLACGSSEKLSADHVIPLSQGGSNSIENIQVLCVLCNCKKGTKVIDYREV